MGSIDGTDPQEVAHGLMNAYRLVGDDVMTIRRAALVSQHFDTTRLAMTGEARTLRVAGVSQRLRGFAVGAVILQVRRLHTM